MNKTQKSLLKLHMIPMSSVNKRTKQRIEINLNSGHVKRTSNPTSDKAGMSSSKTVDSKGSCNKAAI